MNEKKTNKKTSLNRKKSSLEKKQKNEKLEKYRIIAGIKIIQLNGQKKIFMSQLTCLKILNC